MFGDDEISMSNFRFLLQIWGGGILLPISKTPPPKWQHERKMWHSCHRLVQELAHVLCHVPLMGSCSQFCVILHPHRVAVPFAPTFASLWRNSFVQIYEERLCSRLILGPPHKNETKTTKIWGWGHLIVLINPPPGSHRFPMNMNTYTYTYI